MPPAARHGGPRKSMSLRQTWTTTTALRSTARLLSKASPAIARAYPCASAARARRIGERAAPLLIKHISSARRQCSEHVPRHLPISRRRKRRRRRRRKRRARQICRSAQPPPHRTHRHALGAAPLDRVQRSAHTMDFDPTIKWILGLHAFSRFGSTATRRITTGRSGSPRAAVDGKLQLTRSCAQILAPRCAARRVVRAVSGARRRAAHWPWWCSSTSSRGTSTAARRMQRSASLRTMSLPSMLLARSSTNSSALLIVRYRSASASLSASLL